MNFTQMMMKNNIYRYVVIIIFIMASGNCSIYAQDNTETEAPEEGSTSVKQSQEIMNPTTLAWQLQLEDFLIFDTEGQDGVAQNFRFRGIIPLKEGLLIKVPQLLRVITFLNTAPNGRTGLGATSFNQFFILSKKKWGQFGAGWNLSIPTTTADELGSKQWQIGPAATITFTNLGNWQMYWIFENFFSISGNNKYGSSAYAILQPNIFYTWSNGIYAGIEPEWQIDYKTGKVAIPMDFRLIMISVGMLTIVIQLVLELVAFLEARSNTYLNIF